MAPVKTMHNSPNREFGFLTYYIPKGIRSDTDIGLQYNNDENVLEGSPFKGKIINNQIVSGLE